MDKIIRYLYLSFMLLLIITAVIGLCYFYVLFGNEFGEITTNTKISDIKK